MLDSTRPIGNPNTDPGRPKTTSAGVLQSWYVLRATYARELKVKADLEDKGVRAFVPMMWSTRHTRPDRASEKKLVPAVSGLVFVRWTREGIDAYIRSFGEARPVNYYWDRTTDSPLTVPEKAMEDFITIASSMDEDLIYLTEISEKLREGQTVTITEGAFKGVSGKVVRIKKNKRVMVELPGMLAVTTNFVSPMALKIENEK